MLDAFFITCPPSVHALHGVYDPVYVGLSFLVAALASYLALALGRKLSRPGTVNKRLLRSGGALALGIGIWSMHFVGMLAFDMGMPMYYDPWLTVSSMAVAVLSAYGVLVLISRPRLKIAHLAGGAIVLGIGISAMHYIGMEALVMNADMRYRPGIFLLSVAIGITASGAALWISFHLARHHGKYRRYLEICASMVMAAAICGMHYTGMAAAVFIPNPLKHTGTGISSNGISLGLTIVGIVLCLVLPVGIYHSIKDEDQDGADDSQTTFPTKLLWLAVVGNCGALIWVCAYSIYSQHLFRKLDLKPGDAREIAVCLRWIAFVAAMFSASLLGTWYFALRNIRVWRRELRSNRTLLRTIIDNMPLALFVKDAAHDYRWLLMNPMAERLFGIRPEEAIGRSDFSIFSAEQAAFHRRGDDEIMAGRKLVESSNAPVKGPAGSFDAHTIMVPIFDADGKANILLGMTEDVTERKRAEEELRRAKEQAEKSDQAKSEFLANMSHELRTPLNSILGTVRLLQESTADPNQRALADTVSASSIALLEIVNDILDLSKIAAGGLQLEKIGIDPAYVLQSIINRLEPLAREKKITLSLTEPAAPPYIMGDPTRLAHVFTNLISNAIKYTKFGGVRVLATFAPLDAQRIMYRCEVIDSGIGIAAEMHASIFEKFTQADTSTTRKYGGTGLGLAITKQLVELMGGAIGVTSIEGQGSTFWFEIEFEIAASLHREKGSQHRTHKYSEIPAAQARVLIAEDHPMNQILIRRLMTRFGIENYTIAGDGSEAVAKYEAGSWDLILMDCHMPEKNGYDATMDIRAIENAAGRPHVPIIAMTANAMVGDREKCLSVGMDDYTSKPIVIDELGRLMGQWIALREAAPADPGVVPASCCIDLAQMRSFTDGDEEIERELIAAFAAQSTLNISVLSSNQKPGRIPEWVEAAHMLKGGAASIGAEQLRVLCENAQNMEDADTGERVAVLLEIDAAYADVEGALKNAGFLA